MAQVAHFIHQNGKYSTINDLSRFYVKSTCKSTWNFTPIQCLLKHIVADRLVLFHSVFCFIKPTEKKLTDAAYRISRSQVVDVSSV